MRLNMYLNGAEQFADFELVDTGGGYRLERWGDYTLQRPDPQIIWSRSLGDDVWDKADAVFANDQWNFRQEVPESWILKFRDMKLVVRPMNFKHTGVFPEQAANWALMGDLFKGMDKPRVLNLFAYTGAATVWLTRQGAFATHVDASRPAIGWAKDNQELNGLPTDSIRWMLEDAAKFVRNEVKRGAQYEGIVMDPPAFGHSPTGKIWKFNEQMPALLRDCVALLSPQAKFLIINAYATNTSELAIQNLLEDAIKGRDGTIESGQLCLAQKSGRMISTGIFTRWTNK
jgi:23S rRNA (cytosine1962-C5)-methyltransferase